MYVQVNDGRDCKLTIRYTVCPCANPPCLFQSPLYTKYTHMHKKKVRTVLVRKNKHMGLCMVYINTCVYCFVIVPYSVPYSAEMRAYSAVD